jgi:hypothetical protein
MNNKFSNFKFNVVIPTFRRPYDLIRTVDSFLRAFDGFDVEFYVVNNDLNPISLNFKSEKVFILNCLINGPSQARNLAISKMRPCDWVWFADDDLYIFDEIGLRLTFEEDCPDLINFTTFYSNNIFFKIKKKFSKDYRLFNNKINNTYKLSGGNFICKYNLAVDVKWDDSYLGYSYGEDICFGLDVLRSGKYSTVFDPSCIIYHYGLYRKMTSSFLKKQLLGCLYIEKKYNINYFNPYLFFIKVFIYSTLDFFKILELYRNNVNKEYLEVIESYNSLNENR